MYKVKDIHINYNTINTQSQSFLRTDMLFIGHG